MATTRMKSIAHVLGLQELVIKIVEHTGSLGCAVNLGITSRAMFTPCMSVAWRDLSSEIHLLKLLPYTLSEPEDSSHNYMKFTHNDTSRLCVYGPFVKKLGIFKPWRYKWRLTNCNSLLSYAKTHPLLPNLDTLTWNFSTSERYWDVMVCMGLFVSPSLTKFKIEFDGRLSSIGPAVSRMVLESLFDTCPNIQSLSFFPANHERSQSPLDDASSVDHLQMPNTDLRALRSVLIGFGHLTAFQTNLRVLELFPLDGLLNLTSLEVDMEEEPLLNPMPYQRFPLLEHLGLFRCNQLNVAQILPGSGTGLVSLLLSSRGYPDFVQSVVQHLARYHPTLSCLGMHACGVMFHTHVNDIQPSQLQPLQCMSRLHTLRLEGMELTATDHRRLDLRFWDILPRTLRNLEIPTQMITAQQLLDLTTQAPWIQELETGWGGNDLKGFGWDLHQATLPRLRNLKIHLWVQWLYSQDSRQSSKLTSYLVADTVALLCPNTQVIDHGNKMAYRYYRGILCQEIDLKPWRAEDLREPMHIPRREANENLAPLNYIYLVLFLLAFVA
ncbi:fanconi anemia group M protein [Ceratobasidium sp. AG-Ba]|nr:fanconi anemia group M protein [Ceratobasidium sp. AG-Ba]